jgi:hypothetical protein
MRKVRLSRGNCRICNALHAFKASLSLHRASWYKSFTFTNRCTYLLVLESTKIYIKIHTKMLLHISVCDCHQVARNWAWLTLQLLKMFGKNMSLYTYMQWCGSILRQVHSDVYVVWIALHCIFITMDLTQYAATPLHVHNDVFLPNIFNNCNFSQAQVQAPWWWSQTETCRSILVRILI